MRHDQLNERGGIRTGGAGVRDRIKAGRCQVLCTVERQLAIATQPA